MPLEFFSSQGEDEWIARNMSVPIHNATVVEVGVGHWRDGSNSLFFENIGWNVVLVEPHPDLYGDIVKHRPNARFFPCAAGAYDGTTGFMLQETKTHSGIARPGGTYIDVPIRKLSGILDEVGKKFVDILSIDTEGTELDVWAGLDLERHRPGIVIMEWQTAGMPEDPMKILRTILPCGYALVNADGGNFIFQNRK